MPHMANLPWIYMFILMNFTMMYSNTNLFTTNLMKMKEKPSSMKSYMKKW